MAAKSTVGCVVCFVLFVGRIKLNLVKETLYLGFLEGLLLDF